MKNGWKAFGAGTLLALTACTQGPVRAPLGSAPPSGPVQACARIYRPVCAVRNADRRTFPNACEARASGYDVRSDGQCGAGQPSADDGYGGSGNGGFAGGSPGGGYDAGGGYGGNGRDDRRPQSARPGYGAGQGQACAMVYQPVCARSGTETRTFPNACRARTSGYSILYQSECRGGGDTGDAGANVQPNGGEDRSANRPGRGAGSSIVDVGGGLASSAGASAGGATCSRAFVPVCGKKGSAQKTFTNACEARSKGYTVAGEGRCS
ncbi:Kazal-type serine protease inhibitor domain-containing protein [Pararhizobium mangrovi]|uniref:Kazal-type serine protease inhibitor domain-containing protein n=1 Tax=Pararhizobium mangrovi TaxID=2590452 RepID=UPI0015E85D22|nr:Kazal-type serine protease inhibitor domain-containing protein [Pararhizobium mangrovi]